MKKSTLTLSILILFFVAIVSKAQNTNFVSKKASITPKEAAKLLEENVLLIDVREPSEVSEIAYSVKNVKNIPLREIENRMIEIPKDKQVVLACKGGGRSQQAYDLLVKKGYTNLSNLEGGILAWKDAGLNTSSGTTFAPKSACCADPTSKDCNPDGTCKPKKGKKVKKSKKCC
jgi:rhodanese-related sulfurtransferase